MTHADARLRRLVANLPPTFSTDPIAVSMLQVQCTVTTTWSVVGDVLTTVPASGTALRFFLPNYSLNTLAAAINLVAGYTASVVGGVGTLVAGLLLESTAVQTGGQSIFLAGYTAPNFIMLGPIGAALNQFDDDTETAVVELDPLHADGPWLDYWGVAAGQVRYPGESDPTYAERVRSALIRPKENNFALAALACASPAVTTCVIADAILDDFTRPDNPSTLGSTDTGVPWSVAWGSWGIIGQTAYCSLPSGGKAGFAADQFGSAMFGATNGTADAVIGGMATLQGGYSGSAVQATFSTFAIGMRLVFRQTTPGNEWYVEAQGTQWALVKNNANSASTSGTYVATPVNGDIVRVTLVGNLITVFINGVSRITTTDSFNATATLFGMSISDTTAGNARFDHFIVGTPGTFVAVITMAGTATAQDQLNAQSIVNKYKAVGILATFQFL